MAKAQREMTKKRDAAGGAAAALERQSDQAFDKLYEAITRCELAPNSIVSEPQLEQDFKFSRVALRMAIDRLVQKQLMQPLHRRGYRIAPITLRDIKDTFGLRLLVEPPTAGAAAGVVDISRLNRINEKCLVAVRPGDRDAEAALTCANREFHLVIAEASGNRRLCSLLEQLIRDVDRVYHFGLVHDVRFAEMQSDHVDLIAALARGDGAQAEAMSRAHIERGYHIAMDAILNRSGLADVNIGRFAREPVSG